MGCWHPSAASKTCLQNPCGCGSTFKRQRTSGCLLVRSILGTDFCSPDRTWLRCRKGSLSSHLQQTEPPICWPACCAGPRHVEVPRGVAPKRSAWGEACPPFFCLKGGYCHEIGSCTICLGSLLPFAHAPGRKRVRNKFLSNPREHQHHILQQVEAATVSGFRVQSVHLTS